MLENKKSLAQSMGITRTVVRAMEEVDLKEREDRIGKYFKKYLSKFVFDEFSEEYMVKAGIADIMRGVPIPLRKQDLKAFAGGAGLPAVHIAENMAWVMGCDPHFQYTEKYVEFLKKLFNHKIYEGMVKEGRDSAEEGDLDAACIHFRASLCMQPDYLHGMYSYARACRAMYLQSSNPEYVGRFKAEAMDYFELLTEAHPRFAQGFYYLGYAYLNIGLYVKADLAWREFIKFTRNGKDRKEIKHRMQQIADPIQIEHGYNAVLSGRYQEGLQILEPYLETQFKTWWPLSYYVGVSYAKMGKNKDAVSSLLRVLSLNGSHLETMEELVAIFGAQGDKENEQKYKKKIKIIRENMRIDEEEAEKQRIKKQNQKKQNASVSATPEPEEPEHETFRPEVIEEIEESKTSKGESASNEKESRKTLKRLSKN